MRITTKLSELKNNFKELKIKKYSQMLKRNNISQNAKRHVISNNRRRIFRNYFNIHNLQITIKREDPQNLDIDILKEV